MPDGPTLFVNILSADAQMTAWNPKIEYNLPESGAEIKSRPRRVGDLIKNEIGSLLLSKMRDPRLANVTILAVEVTKDLRRANIYYSVFGDDQQMRDAGDGLASAKGYMRSHLARNLSLRVTPELIFRQDLSLVRQEEMERLLKELGSDERPTD